jgi:hypothetical protein
MREKVLRMQEGLIAHLRSACFEWNALIFAVLIVVARGYRVDPALACRSNHQQTQ